MNEVIRARHEELFRTLVPDSGFAETFAGELVRAVSRIEYRFQNDGDHIGVGYGNETCNAAARFIRESLPESEMDYIVQVMWGLEDDEAYSKAVDALIEEEVKLIERRPEFLEEENDFDMYDFAEPCDYRWGQEEEEEEDELSWSELRDIELAEYPPLSCKY